MKELISDHESKLAEKEEIIIQKTDLITEKDQMLAANEDLLAEKDRQLAEKDAALQELTERFKSVQVKQPVSHHQAGPSSERSSDLSVVSFIPKM